MFPPKYFDNVSPEGGCSEALDALRFFLNSLSLMHEITQSTIESKLGPDA